jgi:hypothetical protein
MSALAFIFSAPIRYIHGRLRIARRLNAHWWA